LLSVQDAPLPAAAAAPAGKTWGTPARSTFEPALSESATSSSQEIGGMRRSRFVYPIVRRISIHVHEEILVEYASR
jgi:hypothetical protein